MKKIKVSAVSYSNSMPFIYGLKNHPIMNQIELSLDYPAECAQKLESDIVQIGLVPVAALITLKNAYIFNKYCIGAKGKVRTVLLVSDVPLEQIDTILLDYQSRTSVNLIQILAQRFWKLQVTFKQAIPGFEQTEIKTKTAAVIIGDRAFPIVNHHQYIYDLSEEWNKYTGLPFVFAFWASTIPLSAHFIETFENALSLGIQNIDGAIKMCINNPLLLQVDLKEYYTRYISYQFDEEKKEGLRLFMEMMGGDKMKGIKYLD